jgi:hypothetical protein
MKTLNTGKKVDDVSLRVSLRKLAALKRLTAASLKHCLVATLQDDLLTILLTRSRKKTPTPIKDFLMNNARRFLFSHKALATTSMCAFRTLPVPAQPSYTLPDYKASTAKSASKKRQRHYY